MGTEEVKWPTWQEVIDFVMTESQVPYVPPVYTIHLGLEEYKRIKDDPTDPLHIFIV